MSILTDKFNLLTAIFWPAVLIAISIGVLVGICRRQYVIKLMRVDTYQQANREAWRWGIYAASYLMVASLMTLVYLVFNVL